MPVFWKHGYKYFRRLLLSGFHNKIRKQLLLLRIDLHLLWNEKHFLKMETKTKMEIFCEQLISKPSLV